MIADLQAEHGGEVVEAFPSKLTDIGNGQRFVRQHGDHVRFCADWGEKGWAVWHQPDLHPAGGWWRRDNLGQVVQYAKETATSIAGESSLPPKGMELPEWKSKLREWSHNSQSSGRLNAMLSMAESEPPIAIAADAFDKDHWLLNVQNGTLDLRKQESETADGRQQEELPPAFTFRPARQSDLITKSAGTYYDDKADCVTWRTFLDLIQPALSEPPTVAGGPPIITRGDQAFLQRAVAYSLTGLTTYPEVFFLLCGTAGAGKSTFTDTILALLGDYGKAIPSFMLLEQRNQDRKNEIAFMHGSRFTVAGETDERAKISIATIKHLTGGDRQVGRHLHQQYFQFEQTHKLWLHTNYEPDVGVNDIGFFDRLKLVRFDNRIRDGRGADMLRELCGRRNIKELLKEELAGILNWALEGLAQWRDHGLGDTRAVRDAVERLRVESDRLGNFLNERMIIEAVGEVSIKECWAEWKNYCEESNFEPGGKISFGKRLRELGFKQPDNPKGGKARVWIGLRLREVNDKQPDGLGGGKRWKHPDSGDGGLFEA